MQRLGAHPTRAGMRTLICRYSYACIYMVCILGFIVIIDCSIDWVLHLSDVATSSLSTTCQCCHIWSPPLCCTLHFKLKQSLFSDCYKLLICLPLLVRPTQIHTHICATNALTINSSSSSPTLERKNAAYSVVFFVLLGDTEYRHLVVAYNDFFSCGILSLLRLRRSVGMNAYRGKCIHIHTHNSRCVH